MVSLDDIFSIEGKQYAINASMITKFQMTVKIRFFH